MGKYRVKFELVSTAYAYIEADGFDEAGGISMELLGRDDGFMDDLLGNAEGESCYIVSIDDIDLDSAAYRTVECYTKEDIR